MENEYKLFLNLKDEMKSIYEKNLKNEEYDILINDDKMVSWPIRQAFTKAIVIREEKKGI